MPTTTGYLHEILSLSERAVQLARSLQSEPAPGRSHPNHQGAFTELDALVARIGTASTGLATAAATLKASFHNVV